ncbi:cysteine hydrolase family protein [Pseudonocardia thermophila]|jgi:Amidases related to nicotinamidase|uniref:cysteine hydrolase family protein n=1 Tax=Pseudonocardia thermophila TaxID=1848 RepID=UPI00248D3FCD|nr:isochorismatase family cysteine hydrolase [Pseudonocardia thermophila]
MSRRALLLCDLQIDVCGPGGALGARSGATVHTAARGVLPRVAQVLERARRTGDLVVHARLAFDPAGLRRVNRSPAFAAFEEQGVLAEGTPGAEFCAEAAPLPGELVVTKGGVSPFSGTGLDERLRRAGVDTLLLGGVATNFVVESAARYAGDAGFAVFVLEDLCAAHSEDLHRFAIEKTLPLFATITDSQSAYPAL